MLNRLHKQYAEKGLSIVGFPSYDFGHQEADNSAQIKSECNSLGVEFDMYEQESVLIREAQGVIELDHELHGIDSTADKMGPGLWRWLQTQPNPSGAGGGPHLVRWNFDGNFVLDRYGKLAGAYKLQDQDKIELKIQEVLAQHYIEGDNTTNTQIKTEL